MATFGRNKVKIKQEPVDYAEHVQSLLANAKSAYCNKLDDDFATGSRAHDSAHSYKRKSAALRSSDEIPWKRKVYEVESNGHNDSATISSDRYETRLSVRPEGAPINGYDRKYQCVLCEEAFKSDEDRALHVTLVHKSKSNSGRRQTSRIARHTCQICFARFRTLKDFFTHTAGHAQDPGLTAMQRDISDNVAKNTLQQFLISSVSTFGKEMLQPSFKCDCCNTVFTNRDAYAMHVMMRVKDDCSNEIKKSAAWTNTSDIVHKAPIKTENVSPRSDISAPDLNQAYYIDVTNVAEKDEYLQSVLGSTNEKEKHDTEIVPLYGSSCMKCSICSKSFVDQDSLAMHVMSNHAEEIQAPAPEVKKASNNKMEVKPQHPVPSTSMYVGNLPLMNGNGAINIQGELLYCDFCGGLFTNRDALAMHILSHTASEMKREKLRNAKGTVSNTLIIKTTPSPNIRPMEQIRVEQPLDLASTKNAALVENDLKDATKSETATLQGPETGKCTMEILNENEAISSLQSGASNDEKRSIINTQQDRKFIYRSLSLPDMRLVERATLPRPRSSNNIANENYVYLLNDTISGYENGCASDEGSFGIDLTMSKNTNMEFTKRAGSTPLQEANQRSASVCPSVMSDEVSDPSQFLRHLDRPAYICKYCEIIFLNRTLYYLHKGLHNVNNPWQCNMCGKVCSNVHDFSAHIIHL